MNFVKPSDSNIEKSLTGAAVPARRTYTLVHLSDPHLAAFEGTRLRDFLNKRMYGYATWRMFRSSGHGVQVLAALMADLKSFHSDHTVVTGDLTHLALEAEFRKALRWLQSLGPPPNVSVVPGNHDAYVKLSWQHSLALLVDYMTSDGRLPRSGAHLDSDTIFPSLRRRGPIAIIGVSTGQPNTPFHALGSIGASQRKQFARILSETGREHLVRIVLMHHPPVLGVVSWRKRLTDADAFREILMRYGAEMVLHGHAHRSAFNVIRTDGAVIPCIGVPSISACTRSDVRRSRYHIYQFTQDGTTQGWNVRLFEREFSPQSGRFTAGRERRLRLGRQPLPTQPTA